MLSAYEMALMQRAQASLLPDVAAITRRTYSDSDTGGQIITVSTHALPCRVAASTNAPDREIVAGRAREAVPWRITFAAGANVQTDDTVTVNGRVFEVVAVYGPSSFETARVTVCVEK
jgi:hypothetical protein